MPKKYQKLVWYLLFAQALLAMLGSLYFSNFGDPIVNIAEGNFFGPLGFYPCRFCWWARILMYPIVALSLVGILRKDKHFTAYVLALSIPGLLLETYHYALQKFPALITDTCTVGSSCSTIEVEYFGFITIPFLCLIAFLVINILALVNTWMNRQK